MDYYRAGGAFKDAHFTINQRIKHPLHEMTLLWVGRVIWEELEGQVQGGLSIHGADPEQGDGFIHRAVYSN